MQVIPLKIPEGSKLPDFVISFIQVNGLKGGYLVGIGGLEEVEIGVLNRKTNQYEVSKFTRNGDSTIELLSITGNYFVKSDGNIAFHAHATFATGHEKVAGGHLISAKVSPYVELFLVETGIQVKTAFKHRDSQ
ncbi:DUF296 domain-containing protein [Fervidicoccus fontis]|uniref:PPC domain-containing protein n=2 Tax=Fervidicoccus fontis TaxID=683846 RepID=I0A1D6_FERFK|nr:PPC domain-containing DNA-binding protein [Fervidicoccus fontis]AFH42793.1 hypothetical protein FFONT_0805 [Fervidicoccus fontis Kam940]MBE9391579.1 DUF296 domain-containing protein [Fervidicoccus fontis]